MTESPYDALARTGHVPLTLRIGVAGHRQKRLKTDKRKANEANIKEVYDAVSAALKVLQARAVETGMVSNSGSPLVRLVSSLAEGADRLLVSAHLVPENAQLDCVLPFSRTRFEEDFRTKDSEQTNRSLAEFTGLLKRADYETPQSRVLELTDTADTEAYPYRHAGQELADILHQAGYEPPDSQVLELIDTAVTKVEPYRRAGEVLINHSDLLITLFDGGQNDEGGTWSTILEARRRSIPVIVIDSNAQKKPMLLSDTESLKDNESASGEKSSGNAEAASDNKSLKENESGGDNKSPSDGKSVELTADVLRDALARSLLLNQVNISEDDDSAIADFTREGNLKRPATKGDKSSQLQSIAHTGTFWHWVPPAFEFLKFLIARKGRVNSLLKKWKRATPLYGSEKAVPKQTLAQQRVDAAYQRADALAVHYATAHRNTFVMIYVLGAGALIAAALGLAGLALNASDAAQPTIVKQLPLACVIIELVFLLSILALYTRDHKLKFHQKWLEYRSLAELLRPQQFFIMAGCASGLALLRRIHQQRDESDFGPEEHDDQWIYSYATNVIRWSGFNAGRCDAARRLRDKETTIDHWLRPQIDYHEKNAARMHIMEKGLARLGFFSFWFTLVAVCAKLADKKFDLLCFLQTEFQIWAGLLQTEFQVWAAFFAAFFPVLGTFAFAVRNHAEFGISAKRSVAMREVYLRLIKDFESVANDRNAQIAALNQVFARALSESDEWRSIYVVKESETA